MSRPRLPAKRCLRAKRIFMSEGEAQRALDRNPEWGDGMHPYPCPECRAWHVGHARTERDLLIKNKGRAS